MLEGMAGLPMWEALKHLGAHVEFKAWLVTWLDSINDIHSINLHCFETKAIFTHSINLHAGGGGEEFHQAGYRKCAGWQDFVFK